MLFCTEWTIEEKLKFVIELQKNDYLNSQITWNYFIPGRITSYNKFKKRRKYREMNNKLKKEYKKEKSKQIQCKELQIENIKKKKYREYEI